MKSKTRAELISIPWPGRGHLLANLEMVKVLVSRDRRLTATVLVIRPAYDPGSFAHSFAPQGFDESRIRFVDVSEPAAALSDPQGSTLPLHLQYIENHKDRVREEVSRRIRELEDSDCRLAGVVVDMFCSSMIGVANELGVPSYVFFTCAASTLGLIFHFQELRDYEHQDLTKYADETVSVPSYRFPVPGKLLPTGMLDKDGGWPRLIDQAKRIRGAKGIMVNTFRELEPYAVESLAKNGKIPPVYPVGPILYLGDEKEDRCETLRWLDTQPDLSVVYLCFGSKGTLNEVQVRLIATALERSGHRFLWSLRKPTKGNVYETPGEYENPEEVLPEGFLERTKGVGKVIGWAPQVAVLSHRAVGGFVSHCGWNSTLESLSCGVPMAVWPLSAEQQVNAFLLVKDLKVAVELRMDYKKANNVIVPAEEIENGIRRLMEPGSEVRANAEALKAKSRMAGQETGSSFEFIGGFVEDVLKNSV